MTGRVVLFCICFPPGSQLLFAEGFLATGVHRQASIDGKDMLDTAELNKPADGTQLTREQFRFRRRLIVCFLLMNGVVFALAVFFMHKSKLAYQEEWERQAQSFAHVLAISLNGTVKKMEWLLKTATHDLGRRDAVSQARLLDRFLASHRAVLPELDSLTLFDENGKMRYDTGSRKAADLTITHRRYARLLQSSQVRDRYIVLPFATAPDNEWVLGVAQRIRRAPGVYDGMVLGTIRLSHFAKLLSDIKMGSAGVLALVGEEDAIVVRQQKVIRIDKKLAREKQYANPAIEAFIRARRESGVFLTRSGTDGLNRTTAIRRIGDYPLYVLVGMAEADYLAGWRRNVMVVGVILLAFFLATLLMMLAINISWFRRIGLLKEMAVKQKKFYELADMSSDWFWECDENYRFIHFSRDVTAFGFPPEVIGLRPWDVSEDISEGELADYRHQLEMRQPFQHFEFALNGQDGEKRHVSLSGKPVFDEAGHFRGYHGTGRDITDKKRYEDHVRSLAQYDILTQLPNRALFQDRLDQAISASKREQRAFALLYLDLDKFKPINDRHGHAAGDQLLEAVAARLRTVLRESDTVARFGGDEFAVLLPEVNTLADAEKVAEKIIASVMAPYRLEGLDESVVIGVSVGIAFYPEDGTDSHALLQSGDACMYQSKKRGNCYYYAGRSDEDART